MNAPKGVRLGAGCGGRSRFLPQSPIWALAPRLGAVLRHPTVSSSALGPSPRPPAPAAPPHPFSAPLKGAQRPRFRSSPWAPRSLNQERPAPAAQPHPFSAPLKGAQPNRLVSLRPLARLSFALFIVLGSMTLGWAGKPGSSTANFLRIGVGARAVAMGEAHTAVTDDVYATSWNPAGLARVPQKEAAFMHAQLVEGLQYEYGALALPLRRGTLGVSGGYFSTGNIEGFDHTGVSLDTLPLSYDAMGSLSYGLPLLHDRLAFGLTGRYVYKRLVSRTASTMAGDLGLQYRTPLEGLTVAAVVQHLGGKLKFVSERDPLPQTVKLGAAYQYRWALLALDWQRPRDQDAFLTAGVELRPIQWLALRGGWKTKDDVGPGFRAGAGITIKESITLDYAFLPFGAFGDTHRLSLSVRWGTSRQTTAVSTVSALQPSSSQPPSPVTISTQTPTPTTSPSTTMPESTRLLLRHIP